MDSTTRLKLIKKVGKKFNAKLKRNQRIRKTETSSYDSITLIIILTHRDMLKNIMAIECVKQRAMIMIGINCYINVTYKKFLFNRGLHLQNNDYINNIEEKLNNDKILSKIQI